MELKDVLSTIVNDLEEIGALISTLQNILISKGQLSEAEIVTSLPKIQRTYQDHLSAVRLAISRLPN